MRGGTATCPHPRYPVPLGMPLKASRPTPLDTGRGEPERSSPLSSVPCGGAEPGGALIQGLRKGQWETKKEESSM